MQTRTANALACITFTLIGGCKWDEPIGTTGTGGETTTTTEGGSGGTSQGGTGQVGGTGGTGGSGTTGGTSSTGGTMPAGGAGGTGGSPGCPPITLGITDMARNIVVDSTHVYWTHGENTSPVRVPICGGSPPEPLAEETGSSGSYLVVDDNYVYWAASGNGGSVYRVAKTGGARELLAQDAGSGLTQSATHLYWAGAVFTDSWHYTIERWPKLGGPVETIVPDSFAPRPTGSLAVDDMYLYWLEGFGSSNVYRVPVDGSADPEWISWGDGIPEAFTADDTFVYWVSDFNGSKGYRAPKTGGNSQVIFAVSGYTLSIAVDGGYAYTSIGKYLPDPSSKTGIFRVPTSGGPVEWVVENQISPYGMAFDPLYMYFTNNSGQAPVWQIPKP
ncbi:MAG: DUF5050 domain-containing protein [Polyangiaceae bacterium]|nr:DUF5050 domain-containing protein [Polyangiaceae bacterium]